MSRTLSVNGLSMHVLEEGEGERLVVLLHGFPELAHSWRHQLPALAGAGFHAVAPDLRGYGKTSAPQEVEAYAMRELARDVLALADALGVERFDLVGHDWGAALAWWTALAHPERVARVVGMSVPAVPRAPAPPVGIMREHLGEDFYMVWFQKPGQADAALARDVRRTFQATDAWTEEWASRTGGEERPRPAFWTEDDERCYVEAYTRTGFTGGLNWYRNLDRNWEDAAEYAGRTIDVPALFVTGSRDPVASFMPAQAMDGLVTDLRVVVIDGAGHWVQQERPDEVNSALLEFLG